MAKAATIGALRVSLALDTAQFSSGVDAAQGALASFAKQLKGPLIAAGTAVAGAMAAIGASVKTAIDRAADIKDVSEETGAAVKQLSALAHAAKIEGVELEALGASLGKLSKNLAAIARGEGGDAAKALDALGISVRNADGSLKNSDQVLGEIAGRFGQMEDGAGKAALALALFGKSGASLIPLLNNGAQGLREYTAEAEALGLVIDGKTAKAADTFNENLTRLGQALVGLGTQIAVELLPHLVNLTEKIVDFVKEGEVAKRIVDFVKVAIVELSRFLIEASAAWAELTRWLQAFGDAGAALKNLDMSGVTKAFSDAATDVTKIWADARDEIAKITGEIGSNIGAKGSREDTGKPLRKALAPEMAADPEKIKAIKNQMSELAEEGQRLWEQTRTPMEAFGNEVARLGILMKAGVIDTETYNRAIHGLKEQFDMAGVSFREIGSTIGQSLSSMFDDAIEGSLNLIDSLKDLAKQLAELVISSAFRSLVQGMDDSGGGVGGAVAGILKGMAGFASGGSFQVGGAGGIDSQVVAFKASPNERVSVTKPGQERGHGANVVNNIVTPPGAKVETQQRDQGGVRINDIVISIIDQYHASDRGQRAMSAIYGVSPSQRRR